MQVTVRVSKGKRHPILLPCKLRGVVDGLCPATSLIEQVAECVGKYLPDGPAVYALALAIGPALLSKKDGRYTCEDSVPGEVEVDNATQLSVQVRSSRVRTIQLTSRQAVEIRDLEPKWRDATPSNSESDTGGRGGSGSDTGSGKTSASQHGSTRSRPSTRSSELEATIREYLQSNPASRIQWEEFPNYRGRCISLMDSLEFFRDHVIPLTTLVSPWPRFQFVSLFLKT